MLISRIRPDANTGARRTIALLPGILSLLLSSACPTGDKPELNPDVDKPLSDDLPSGVGVKGSVLNLPCTGALTGIGVRGEADDRMNVRGKVRMACTGTAIYKYRIYRRLLGDEAWTRFRTFDAMDLVQDNDLTQTLVNECIKNPRDRPRVAEIMNRVQSEIRSQGQITERAAQGFGLIEAVAPAYDGDKLCFSERLGLAFRDDGLAQFESEYLLTYELAQKVESEAGTISEVELSQGWVRYVPLPPVPPPDPLEARVLDRAYSGHATDPDSDPPELPAGLDLGQATQNDAGWWGPIELKFPVPTFEGPVPDGMKADWFNPYLFFVERKEPDGEWVLVSERPLVAGVEPSAEELADVDGGPYSYDKELTYMDTDVVAGTSYTYRVYGVDIFARKSVPSEPVTAVSIFHPNPIQMVLDGKLHVPANPPDNEREITCEPASPKVHLYWGVLDKTLEPAPRSIEELPGAPVRITPNNVRISTDAAMYDERFMFPRVRITRAPRVEVSEENGFPGDRPDAGYPDDDNETSRPSLYGQPRVVATLADRRFSTPLPAAGANPDELPYFETSVPENGTYQFVLEGELVADGRSAWESIAEWVVTVPDVTPPCAPGPGSIAPKFRGRSGANREEMRRRYGELQSDENWAERFAEVEAEAEREYEDALERFQTGLRQASEVRYDVIEYTGRISQFLGEVDLSDLPDTPLAGVSFGSFSDEDDIPVKVGPPFANGGDNWTLFLAPPTTNGRMGALRMEAPEALPELADRIRCAGVQNCISGYVTPLFFKQPGLSELTGVNLPDALADCPADGTRRPCRDIDWIRFTSGGAGAVVGTLKIHYQEVREVSDEPEPITEAQLVARAVQSAFEQEYRADLPWLLYDLGGVEVSWEANAETDLVAYTGCRIRRGEVAAVENEQRYCGINGDADLCGVCTNPEGCEGAPCRDMQMRRPAIAPLSWVAEGVAELGERVWLDRRAADEVNALPYLEGAQQNFGPLGQPLGRRIEPRDFVDENGVALVDTPTTFDPIGGGDKERFRWYLRAIDEAGNEGPPRIIPESGWFSPAPFLAPRAPTIQRAEVMSCAQNGDPCQSGEVPRNDRTCVRLTWNELPVGTLDVSGNPRPADLRVLLRRTLALTTEEGESSGRLLQENAALVSTCSVDALQNAYDEQDNNLLQSCYDRGVHVGARTYCDAFDLPPGRSVIYQVQALAPPEHGRPPGALSNGKEAGLPGAPCRDFERMNASLNIQRMSGRVVLLPGATGYANGGRVYGRPKLALLQASQSIEGANAPWTVDRQVDLIAWDGQFRPQAGPPPERRHRYRLQVVEPTGRTCAVSGEWVVEPN